MKNFRSIIGLLATMAWISSAPALAADLAADAAQVATQAALMPALKQSAATAAGYEAIGLEVTSTAHQTMINTVNSKVKDPFERRASAGDCVEGHSGN